MKHGGKPRIASVVERQQKLDPEKKVALEKVFYGKFQGAIGGDALLVPRSVFGGGRILPPFLTVN